MRDDPALAAALFARIAPFVPRGIGGSHVAGLNERLRFLKYDVGDFFREHMDGCYTRPRWETERRRDGESQRAIGSQR
jgi:hypothetical protein